MKTLKESGLNKSELISAYKLIKLGRRLDERLWQLNRIGKTSFNISGQGAEVSQVAMALAFDPKTDYFLPYYRDLTAVLCWGVSTEQILLGSLGKEADPASHGRQMPNHYGSLEHNVVSFSSTVTTQYPVATGVAYAAQLDNKPYLTLTTTGEGSTSEGDFHEALNFAGIKKLPAIFVIENNGYAISTPNDEEFATHNLADRAKGYGIAGVQVDGHDFSATYLAFKTAVQRAKDGKGATLIEVLVDRLTAHSSDDDQSVYRDAQELKEMNENDNITIFEAQLKNEKILSEAEMATIDKTIKQEINEATKRAETYDDPAPETLLTHIYQEETED